MKRSLNLLMALVLIFSLFSPAVSAEEIESTSTDEDVKIISVEEGEGVDSVEPPDGTSQDQDTEDSKEIVPVMDSEDISTEVTENEEESTTDDQAEEVTEEGEQDLAELEEGVTEEELELRDIDEDLTDKAITSGFNLKIFYSEYDGGAVYIPTFELIHATETGEVLSIIEAGPQNFDKTIGAYNIVFENPGYKLGEKYLIHLKDKEDVVESITVYSQHWEGDNLITESTIVEKGQHATVEVRDVVYFEGDNDETVVRGLEPSSLHPVTAVLNTVGSKVGFYLETPDGAKLKNEVFTLHFNNGKSVELKTNDRGVAWLDNSKIETKTFNLVIKDKNKKVADTDFGIKNLSHFDKEYQDALKMYRIVVDEKVAEGSSLLDIGLTVNGNTDLTDQWIDADLIFTNNEGVAFEYTLNVNGANVILPDGEYKVSAKSEYADVTLSSNTVSVKNGKGSLNVTVSPKYILEVGKKGKDYNFTVVNVLSLKDKKYTGKNNHSFGVVPNQSFMIKDNDTDEVYTVIIKPDSYLTKLVLGTGVMYGGTATTPHTGDAIMYLVGFFLLFLVAAGVSFMMYRKKRNLKTTSLTVLLLGALLLPFLPSPSEVKASGNSVVLTHGGFTVGSSTGGSSGGSQSTPAGYVQTHPTMSLLMVSFTHGESFDQTARLWRKSNSQDFEHPEKFKAPRLRNSFFIAPNQTVYNKFASSSSSFALFDKEKGALVPYWGSLPFGNTSLQMAKANRDKVGISVSELKTKLLPLPENVQSGVSGDKFHNFVGSMFKRISSSPANRQLWTGQDSSSTMNIGDAITAEYMETIYDNMKGNQEWLDTAGTVNHDVILYSYLAKLRQGGQEEKEVADLLESEYQINKTSHVFFFQVVQAFYVKGDHSKYMFMPMSDAVEWFLWGRQKENPTKFNSFNGRKQAYVLHHGTAGNSGWSKVSPTFTYLGNVSNTSAKAVKPQSENLPIVKTSKSAEVAANPFLGWGFVNLGYEGTYDNEPKLKGKWEIEILDDEGKPTGGVDTVDMEIQTVNGETRPLNISLKELENAESIRGTTSITDKDGNIYVIQPQDDAKLTLVDEKDPSDSLLKPSEISEGYHLNAFIDGLTEVQMSIPNAGTGMWELEATYDIPPFSEMYYYLGGKLETEESIDDPAFNKYAGTEKSSDALLTIRVKGWKICDPSQTECDPSTSPPGTPTARVIHDVPEWRLTKYLDDISPEMKVPAVYNLRLPIQTFRSPRLSPKGTTAFSLVDSKLPERWALSKPKLFNDVVFRNIDVSSNVHNFNLAGDILLIKDNQSVGNVKMASWKSNTPLLDNRIGVTTMGEHEDKPIVKKDFTFKYGVKNPISDYTYSELRRCCDPPSWYRWYGPASPTYYTANYATTVFFNRHIPKESVETTKFESKKEDWNGYYWESYQDDKKLNVNPEVLMAYDDTNGNTSVTFTAGDQMRQIQPVHYNMAQYVRVDIEPKVDGMSVATDQKAKQLASSLNAGGKGVIYKGSSLTTNFEVAGDLELRTFAIDIGSSSLKNAWGNSGYSTDAVNEEFLQRHATKLPDGKWEVEFTADGKLKIDGKDYGGVTETKKVVQKSQTVTEHTLVIRGGKLHSVNGDTNLNNLHEELRDALERMNISVEDNIFNTFERKQGANLDEQNVADLGNMVRGTNDLKVGEGWYNEDSTVLVIREYINIFELPHHLYVDKLPMEIPGLEVPMDKNQFFSKGYRGHTKLKFSLVDTWMEFDSSQQPPFGGDYSIDYIVPNTSIMDTFQ